MLQTCEPNPVSVVHVSKLPVIADTRYSVPQHVVIFRRSALWFVCVQAVVCLQLTLARVHDDRLLCGFTAS